MPHQPNPLEPIPQCGAVLYFNSELDVPERPLRGLRDWDLDGSCALIAPDIALSVRHTTLGARRTERGRLAVFLPGQGIFFAQVDVLRERGGEGGDYLVLLHLKKDGPTSAAPVQAEYVSRKEMDRLEVFGFGSWKHGGMDLPRGIQRGFEVVREPNRDSDNLDLKWIPSKNAGLQARWDNSGGPVLWVRDGSKSLVAVHREEGEGGQLGSRIAARRQDRLTELLGNQPGVRGSLSKPSWTTFHIRAGTNGGKTFRLKVPDDVTKARATLSCTPGLMLQMLLEPSPPPLNFLQRVARTVDHHGQFLYREVELTPNNRDLTVGVAALEGGPEPVPEVEAQVCVLFE